MKMSYKNEFYRVVARLEETMDHENAVEVA
jgi:hypothetical protein